LSGTTEPSADVTTLLKAWRLGDRGALDRLTPLVYDHLRRLARNRGSHANCAAIENSCERTATSNLSTSDF
jgi:hypothetical protein